ncbi:hypothetical protein EZS27_036228 [termite gut metagenome]|uniref:DUF3575 domain-containing protein n=1 Tax=termite gut metagenome TaxID=433724 RepID=A0A5J4PW07_9ZZZZ
MKKILLLVLVCLVSCSSFAQTKERNQELKSIVGISPIRLWNSLRIKYERVLNSKFTYGGILTGYYTNYTNYPGVQLTPIIKFYFKEKAPKGFYAQAKILAGFSQNNSFDSGVDEKQFFTSFGAGIAVGYQLLWGKDNRWSIDMNVGFKYTTNAPEPKDDIYCDHVNWHIIGPGSIPDGLVSIGYRF